MNKIVSSAMTVDFKSGEELSSSPLTSLLTFGLSLKNPLVGAVSIFLTSVFQQQQYESIKDFLAILDSKTKQIEKESIDKEFLSGYEGKRILGKVLRSIVRDNRREKIAAMSTLTKNLFIDRKTSIEEKELYVDILDQLNSLQLSILQKAVSDMRTRVPFHRGLGWEIIAKAYEQSGISKDLVLQSIRTLESNGVFNENKGTVNQIDQTHFISDFGEKFYDYITDDLPREINNELINELEHK